MPVLIRLNVHPKSKKQGFELKQGQIHCYLQAAPEKGLANRELIKRLSKTLKTPQAAIQIVGGATSRNKTVKIENFDTEKEVLKALGLEQQESFL